MNKIIVVGRLTKDPDFKTAPSGTSYCIINVAVNRRKKGEADFITFKAFNKLAENITNFKKKGDQIAIEGEVRTGSRETETEKQYFTDFIITNVEFLGSANNNSAAASDMIPVDDDLEDIPF